MENTVTSFKIGDIIRVYVSSDFKFGIVVDNKLPDGKLKIAVKNLNPIVKFNFITADVAAVEHLSRQMVTDDIITSDFFKEANKFWLDNRDELRLPSRVQGGRKKTNKKRKSKSRTKKMKSKRFRRR
jgi:hypothetical protein